MIKCCVLLLNEPGMGKISRFIAQFTHPSFLNEPSVAASGIKVLRFAFPFFLFFFCFFLVCVHEIWRAWSLRAGKGSKNWS